MFTSSPGHDSACENTRRTGRCTTSFGESVAMETTPRLRSITALLLSENRPREERVRKIFDHCELVGKPSRRERQTCRACARQRLVVCSVQRRGRFCDTNCCTSTLDNRRRDDRHFRTSVNDAVDNGNTVESQATPRQFGCCLLTVVAGHDHGIGSKRCMVQRG